MEFVMNDPELKSQAEKIAKAYGLKPIQWHLTDSDVLKVILADGRAILWTKGDPLPEPEPEPKAPRKTKSDASGTPPPDA